MSSTGGIESYNFLAPRQIVFGWGRRREIGKLSQGLGSRVFVITGSRTLDAAGEIDAIRGDLNACNLTVIDAGSIHREPQVADVDRCVAEVAKHNPGEGDIVLGIGGGSAIDLAKAAAALAVQREFTSVVDYLEGVGRGFSIDTPPLPMIAIPTTAGTGSEATKNAVISSHDPPFKKSLRSADMIPRLVIVDAELTVHCPPHVTAHSGMDAITQLIESYLSRRATPMTDTLALAGLEGVAEALPIAYDDGRSRAARERMSQAALLSGLALANSGLGMAHGVAAALGAVCQVPHGLACAVMLPCALRVNCEVVPERVAKVGEQLAGRSMPASQAASTALEIVEQLLDRLKIPKQLRDLGVRSEHIDSLVRASQGNSLSGNPKELSDDELKSILEAML